MVQITAMRWVPPFAQGLVRDLRVRWALEEAGIPYTVRLIDLSESKQAPHLKRQPFGQVPVYEEDDLVLFESGSILLHIAEHSPVLWPEDRIERAKARTWIFAAINSVEPAIQNLATIDLFNAKESWAIARRPEVLEHVRQRLGRLADRLGQQPYLENRFTAGDLMMTTVLRTLRHTEILAQEFPSLEAFRLRCEARPAFKKALDAQMKPFLENAPI
jgi:glutathione S-transferase